MKDQKSLPRRDFLKQAAGAASVLAQVASMQGQLNAEAMEPSSTQPDSTTELFLKGAINHGQKIDYPRIFTDRHLATIAFPLGGVGAGSLRLGGRGQLRDWEIFNRPNKGFSPAYAFPAIWAQTGDGKPVVRVLESRILPPFEGQDGLGSNNSPGFGRLDSATFIGAYPFAEIKFNDKALPVQVELEAFSPFIPHDPDDSGLPVAVMRYRVTNPGLTAAKVSIAFCIDNPVSDHRGPPLVGSKDKRRNEIRGTDKIRGLLMDNPGLPADDPGYGSFAVAALPESGTEVTQWRGWPAGPWWNSPLLFWDAFGAEGRLIEEPADHNNVGALSQHGTLGPGASTTFTFLLAWHFPNRTPDWCGWAAPPNKGKTIIGNFYATRFRDAWAAAEYTSERLASLEQRTRLFASVFRESTLPSVVKDAATSNLSTLASTTCFRTADGEFHGFEGSDDSLGCCYGNCTHVWNYETATPYLFPTFARSLRKASFGFSLDQQGAIRARQVLPDGETRDEIAAADGHMGQVMHAYLDWKLSGDEGWLQAMWPRVKRAMEFTWVEGGWDPQRSGVLGGVQNNTYDVAFYGPNPLGGIFYLGALRAAEEMGRSAGDAATADLYRSLFLKGSRWTDEHLFNGEFYIQQIKAIGVDEVTPVLRVGTEINRTGQPEYQMGAGCLIDQLLGQYLADVMSLGPLVSGANLRTTLRSIYKYNYKRTLLDHNNTERTFALNDEAAMVICDYGTATRPRVPFPYFAEVMTGFEHATAALMIYNGMVDEGVECIGNIRARYDGEKRNPWDEAECGHHYARAMASWTAVIALSGFSYDGPTGRVTAVPRLATPGFRCFWSSATGWGVFGFGKDLKDTPHFKIEVLAGSLPCSSLEVTSVDGAVRVRNRKGLIAQKHEAKQGRTTVIFETRTTVDEGDFLEIEMNA